jgi:hypothetical protein
MYLDNTAHSKPLHVVFFVVVVQVHRREAAFFVIKLNNAPAAVRPIGSQRKNWQLNSWLLVIVQHCDWT